MDDNEKVKGVKGNKIYVQDLPDNFIVTFVSQGRVDYKHQLGFKDSLEIYYRATGKKYVVESELQGTSKDRQHLKTIVKLLGEVL